MTLLKHIFAISFVVIGVFFMAAVALAQIGDQGQISVTITPEIPGPFQRVTITLVSFAVDLDRSTITWSVDGKGALIGRGEKKLVLSAGDIGETKRLRVSVNSPTAGVITLDLSITPGEVDLIWEAVGSYVPPFYRGKALPSSESPIRVVALPNMKSGGAKIKAESLVYRWRRNDKTELDPSGFGKNTFNFKGGYAEDEGIEVVAGTLDSGLVSQGKIFISIGEPFIAFYENRPLEGIHYEEALPAQLVLPNQEIKLAAEPYFFSLKNKDKNSLSFTWLIGDKEVPGTEEDSSAITLRAPKDQSGISSMALSVKHASKLLQEKDKTMIIRFGNTQ